MKCADIEILTDSRGELGVLDPLPGWVKRVYWISAAQGQIRGGHRHKSTFQQLILVSGCVDVSWQLPGQQGISRLRAENKVMSLPPELFHDIHFVATSVLLVLASESYDQDDYIFEKYREI